MPGFPGTIDQVEYAGIVVSVVPENKSTTRLKNLALQMI